MSAATGESVHETSIVSNEELDKEVDDKKEKNRLLQVALEEVKTKLEEVVDATKRKEEDNEEPFLKAIKSLRGKALEGVSLFSGKMDIDVVMDWIDGMENHFEYEGLSEA